MWAGSLVVTLNAQLLGARISIFQSLCVSRSVLPFITAGSCAVDLTTFGGIWGVVRPSVIVPRLQVLGYCVFPLTVSALIIALLSMTWLGKLWLNLGWLALGFIWATRVSSIFVGQFVKRERRLLALYPVFFFYLLLGWLILLF